MNTNTIRLLPAASILLLSAAAHAQTITSVVEKSATHIYDVGDAEVGAEVQFDASASLTTTRQYLARYAPPHVAVAAGLAAEGRVLFRGSSYVVGGVDVGASASAGSSGETGTSASASWSASAGVQILDKTIFTKSFSGSVASDFDLWSMQRTATLFDFGITYPLVLGLTATARFQAAASISGGIGLTADPIVVGVGLNSNFGAGASGSVSIGLAYGCVQVSAVGTLKLLQSSIAPNVAVNYPNGIQGGFNYSFAALQVVAELVYNGCGWLSGTVDLYDRIYGQVSGTKSMQ